MSFVRRLAKYLLVTLAFFAGVFFVFFAVDRFLFAPVCPPCHTEAARKLPDFGGKSVSGLVNIVAGSLKFRSRVAGFDNAGGEGVILLHGYPETSIKWGPLQEALAQKGYRTVAFDQRGYSPGARPRRTQAYRMDNLVNDVITIADAVGFETFHLVAHDFGGLVGWNTADRFADRVISLSMLSTPHPEALRDALFSSRRQLKHSSYALLNFIPGVSELVLGFNRAAYLKRTSWSVMSEELRSEYEQVFTEPGALTAVLNWYRANSFFFAGSVGKTQVPVLYIWALNDGSLSRSSAEKTADYVTGPFRMVSLNANHQLMSEVPDRVTREISGHLKNWPQQSLASRSNRKPDVEADKTCEISKPSCLRVTVSPSSQSLQVINKCEDRYTGQITIRCARWASGKFVRFEFDVGPGGRFQQGTSGFSVDDCYYNQNLCKPDR